MLPVNQTKKQPSYTDPDFRKKLQEARDFKRDNTGLTVKLRLWLKPALLLKSKWFWRVLGLVIVALDIALYLPGPWQANQILVYGLTDKISNQVLEETNNYLNSRDPILPKRNLFFISKAKMFSALQERIPQLANTDIKFKPGRIEIFAQSYDERFLLKNQEGKQWVLLETGVITKILEADQPHASLIELNTKTDHSPMLGDHFLSGDLLKFIQGITKYSAQIPDLSLQSIDLITTAEGKSFNLSGSDPEEIPVGVKLIEQEVKAQYQIAGHKFFVQFKTDTDPKEVFNNLSSLLSQVTLTDKSKLYYIDLRLSQKAFVCLVNTACASKPIPEVTEEPPKTSK